MLGDVCQCFVTLVRKEDVSCKKSASRVCIVHLQKSAKLIKSLRFQQQRHQHHTNIKFVPRKMKPCICGLKWHQISLCESIWDRPLKRSPQQVSPCSYQYNKCWFWSYWCKKLVQQCRLLSVTFKTLKLIKLAIMKKFICSKTHTVMQPKMQKWS